MTFEPDRVHAELRRRGAMLATAESLTGGRLAAVLTQTPGASQTYAGGVVTYATALKRDVLGVSEQLLAAHGVVSAECALAMARGVRALTGAAYAVSTTGVAGPGPADGVPAGRVFIGIVGPMSEHVAELDLTGDRSAVQTASCEHAVSELLALLLREG